jgi:hypothetical protein
MRRSLGVSLADALNISESASSLLGRSQFKMRVTHKVQGEYLSLSILSVSFPLGVGTGTVASSTDGSWTCESNLRALRNSSVFTTQDIREIRGYLSLSGLSLFFSLSGIGAAGSFAINSESTSGRLRSYKKFQVSKRHNRVTG